MKVKVFKHNGVEECLLCHKVVKTEYEDWVAVVDYSGNKLVKVKCYHKICMTDLIKGKGQIIAQNISRKIGTATMKMLNNIRPAVEKLNKENATYPVYGIPGN